jgi:DNA-binding NarL/FixJ family response regulator
MFRATLCQDVLVNDRFSSRSVIRVLLADDEPLMREALRVFVTWDPELQVVGEASTGVEAVRLVQELNPDVVLMDLQMPELDGIEATRTIAAAAPDTKVIVVSSHVTEEHVLPALLAGAAGYMVKDSRPEEIVAAIKGVAQDECPISSQVSGLIVRKLRRGDQPASGSFPAELRLSQREVEVLDLLCLGYNNKEIAGKLYLSEPTVKTYLSRMLHKSGSRDRVQLVLRAVDWGRVPTRTR